MTTGDLGPEGQHASSATQNQRRQLCFQPNNFKFLAVVPVIVAVLALPLSVAAQDHRYELIDLDTPGGLKSGEVLPGGNINNRGEAAINDHGKGVGFTHTDTSPSSFIGIFSVPSIAQKSQEAATSTSEITISVHDYADVPPFRLAAAEASARRIFGLAGVKTVWLSCSPKLEESEPADCSTVDATHLVLKILSGKTTAHVRYRDDVLGNVLLTDDGVSYFAYAFFDHIEMLEQRLNAPVLGYVLAHEIGHLLLGSNTHSVSGIMSPHWNGPELLRISEGNLLFLPNECQKLRERLRLRKVNRRDLPAVSGAPQQQDQRQILSHLGGLAASNAKAPPTWIGKE